MSRVAVAVLGTTTLFVSTLALGGCSKKESHDTSSAPSASAPSAPSAATPSTTSAGVDAGLDGGLRADCPEGSSGEGTFNKPCEAQGNARFMDVVWTGKTDDKGPYFRVTNKAPRVVLYGKTVVYFYDKAGKQLEVKDSSGASHPHLTCGGNMFSGVMKAGEKAVLTFSCVEKKHVPEGTAAIEAEMVTVGFADASEKKADLYLRNGDLAPDTRRKGGVK